MKEISSSCNDDINNKGLTLKIETCEAPPPLELCKWESATVKSKSGENKELDKQVIAT